MRPYERQQRILEVLCQRRHDTYDNLAQEFHVSKMTIRRDIEVLSCSCPIETVWGGRYGGVRIMDGAYSGKTFLNPEQTELLRRLRTQLDGHDRLVLTSILYQFTPSRGMGSDS